MKKVLFSVAAASLMMGTVASAEVDLKTSGQAVLYYETSEDSVDEKGLFNQDNSQANYGIQLNVDGDIGNGFTFGSQLSYLGTLGLEKNVVSGVKQNGGDLIGLTSTDLMLTKLFIAKQAGNTTIKLGRQELPKSLSPFAFSEGWNVFKNTFDASLIINTDIPDTTVVGAYVAKSNSTIGDGLLVMEHLGAVTNAGKATVDGPAYMLTVQNKSIPMTTLTGSYYGLVGVGNNLVGADTSIHADAFWLDAKLADKDLPLGLNFGLQGGLITPESDLGGVAMADTIAFGAKAGMKLVDNALALSVAFSSVDGDKDKVNVAMKNTGTGVKTPLYTQMVYNQNAIALDATTVVAKAAYNTGDYGTVIAQYGATSGGDSSLESSTLGEKVDYGELDLMYKVKAGGVQYFAAVIMRTWSEKGNYLAVQNDSDSDNRIRLWGRYNF